MPFGLHNAPATWQRLIDRVLGPELEPYVFSYFDDVIIVSDTFNKHLEVLKEVMSRFEKANLTINFEKSYFCREELKYLGYVVNREGLHVDPDKVRAIIDLPTPKFVSDVKSVIGTASWYQKFVPNFSSIIAPLTPLLRKNARFIWNKECAKFFEQIKDCLIKTPALSNPDYTFPSVVQTDASSFGIGAVLSQPHPDGEKVIYK